LQIDIEKKYGEPSEYIYNLSTPDSFFTNKDSPMPSPCKQGDDFVIDLFSLKVLAILMGKDFYVQKETLFFEMIAGDS